MGATEGIFNLNGSNSIATERDICEAKLRSYIKIKISCLHQLSNIKSILRAWTVPNDSLIKVCNHLEEIVTTFHYVSQVIVSWL